MDPFINKIRNMHMPRQSVSFAVDVSRYLGVTINQRKSFVTCSFRVTRSETRSGSIHRERASVERWVRFPTGALECAARTAASPLCERPESGKLILSHRKLCITVWC